jgi:hypothetical protein
MLSSARQNSIVVVGSVIDQPKFRTAENFLQYGAIQVALQNSGIITAYPISVNNLQIPLPGETVLIMTGPNYYIGDIGPQTTKTYYYMSTFSTLGNLNHNVRPKEMMTISQTNQETKPNSSVNLDGGISVTRRDTRPSNGSIAMQKSGAERLSDTQSDVRTKLLAPEGLLSFKEKVVKPLQYFQGDQLFQGRFGNAIRLSGTHTINNGSDREYDRYPYWKGDQENDPFIAITCGISDDVTSGFNIENPDTDDSSIILSSRQRIQNMTLSQPKRVSGFTAMTSYANPQIVITSDRLVFNSKQDEILLSGKKTVGIATPGWAMDMNKMFDILEGMLSELAALTSAQATFATGVGPSGPSTNAGAVQELLGSLRNMKQ